MELFGLICWTINLFPILCEIEKNWEITFLELDINYKLSLCESFFLGRTANNWILLTPLISTWKPKKEIGLSPVLISIPFYKGRAYFFFFFQSILPEQTRQDWRESSIPVIQTHNLESLHNKIAIVTRSSFPFTYNDAYQQRTPGLFEASLLLSWIRQPGNDERVKMFAITDWMRNMPILLVMRNIYVASRVIYYNVGTSVCWSVCWLYLYCDEMLGIVCRFCVGCRICLPACQLAPSSQFVTVDKETTAHSPLWKVSISITQRFIVLNAMPHRVIQI